MGYDDALPPLPGQAIIIHEVDTTREIDLNGRVAQVVDTDNNGNPNDEGAMWVPGEAFIDATNQITVTINSATSTGYVVTIKYFPILTWKTYLPIVLKSQ
jgi:hypothetical protein